MSINANLIEVRNNLLLECPFINSCVIPKAPALCKFPECKICSEFEVKTKKITKNIR